MSPGARVTLKGRFRRGSARRVLYGAVEDANARRLFCLKWCPSADADAIELTRQRANWWHRRHGALSARAADVLGVWPDEKVMLLEWRRGERLGRYLDRQFTGLRGRTARTLDCLGARIGEWLRAFSAGDSKYDADIEPMLGLQARRTPDGALTVNARRLLEQRVALGERAAHTLYRAGVSAARSWADRFDIDAIIGSFTEREPGGFIHGDFKPDNILVSGDDWSVVDWWTTPRISWPLADVATFGANLRFYGDRHRADRLWRSFIPAYYGNGLEERTRRAIDLVGTIMCLGVVAEKARPRAIGRRVAQRSYSRIERSTR